MTDTTSSNQRDWPVAPLAGTRDQDGHARDQADESRLACPQ